MNKKVLLNNAGIKNIIIIALLCFIFIMNVSYSVKADDEISYEDYNGKPIGVLIGPLMTDIAEEYFPDSEHLLFNSYSECIAALLTNKIDGYLADEPGMKMLHAEQKEIDYIHERITNNKYSFAFKKNDEISKKLCDELNEFLSKSYKDGTMKELEEIWFGTDKSRKAVDMSDLAGERIIRVAITSNDVPFCYIKDNNYVGYDIDLIVRFCRDRGYGLELYDVDFAGRIPMIESGKCDFTTDMNVTAERQEQVLFSDPTSYGGVVLAVRSSDLKKNKSQSIYENIDDLAGKTIGVTTGSIHDGLVENRLPSAKIVYFGNFADLSAALKSKQIDAFACPYSTATFMSYEDDSLVILDEHLKDAGLAFATSKDEKGKKLNKEVSDYVLKLKSDGSMKQLHDKWFGNDESIKTIIDYSSLPNINGSITVATEGLTFPYTYIKDGQISGFEIEIMADFCKENGYAMKIEQMNFEGILASVQTGKCDIAASCLAITEERKQSVDFCESHCEDGVVIVTLKTNETEKASCIDNLKDSFYKTFIKENRYKLFIEGIGTTTLITVLSIVFGTMLGFVVFMLCRNGNVIANKISNFCVWLIQGMPMVVLLMVLYYIIFGSVKINNVIVAVIGFSITFAASVFSLLKIGVGAIDNGQYEAAYALGHTNRDTFYRIILPQAIPHVLPAYQGEIVSLLKATAVVGYIAIQDLTKMGDVVRSRTYEAFFPLIAVTIIYFVLESLFSYFVSKINIQTDYKRRKPEQILKGVNIHD